MQEICFICIKRLYNIETNVKIQKEKINIEALNEKVQKLEININYMNLRLELLEEVKKTLKIDKKQKGVIIEEACKAQSVLIVKCLPRYSLKLLMALITP